MPDKYRSKKKTSPSRAPHHGRVTCVGVKPSCHLQAPYEARHYAYSYGTISVSPAWGPAALAQVLQKAGPGLNVRLSQASGSEICISTKKKISAGYCEIIMHDFARNFCFAIEHVE